MGKTETGNYYRISDMGIFFCPDNPYCPRELAKEKRHGTAGSILVGRKTTNQSGFPFFYILSVFCLDYTERCYLCDIKKGKIIFKITTMEMFVEHSCLKCGYPLYDEVYDYSIRNHGFPLCRVCQCWLTNKTKATEYAKRLYLELKKRHVPVEIEKFDGHKTIDIAIPRFRINIEVDGSHHNIDSKQALVDLQRTKYSLEKGYETIRIPNSLIKDSLNQTADSLVVILKNRKKEMDDERLKSINIMELSPREVQLYDLLVDFLKWLYIVFEVDGEYTKTILENTGTEGILSDTYGNWANHEYMLTAFNKLTDYMQDNNIFESATPGLASDYEGFCGCSLGGFLERNRNSR